MMTDKVKKQSTGELASALSGKVETCRGILTQCGSVVVAFSGGVDSSFLLALAIDTLGRDKVLAVRAVSTIFPQRETNAARQTAQQLKANYIELETTQLADPHFTSNPADRCFYCKMELFGRLIKLAAEQGYAAVISGANADDPHDFRPGLRAEKQLDIRSPLLEAGLTKQDIRDVSRSIALKTWNKPSMACLASRVPYGQEITAEKLTRIEQAEGVLAELGFRECRVRDHETVARIEIVPDQIGLALELRGEIITSLKSMGYTYVAVDLEGFRSGSMNEVLDR